MSGIGKLKEVDVRELWKHEQYNCQENRPCDNFFQYLVYRDRDEAIIQSQIGQLSAMQESGIVRIVPVSVVCFSGPF